MALLILSEGWAIRPSSLLHRVKVKSIFCAKRLSYRASMTGLHLYGIVFLDDMRRLTW